MVDVVASAGTNSTATKAGTTQASQAPNPALNSDPSKSVDSKTILNAPFIIETKHTRQRWLKALIYGPHGSGKTELIASSVDVESMRDVIMVDAERGDTTLEENERIKNVDLISTVRVTNFKQVAYIQEFLTAYCRARDIKDFDKMRKLYCQVTGKSMDEVTSENVPQFKTVLIDSLTEVEGYCTYQILNIDSGKMVIDDMDVAGWPEFRKNLEMMKLLVRAYRDLPMNVLFACAESYNQDEQKRYHYQPQLTGKLATSVQGFVDIVGRMVVGAATPEQPVAPRRLYVQPVSGGAKFDAKNRKSVYKNAFFEDPTMHSIMSAINMIR